MKDLQKQAWQAQQADLDAQDKKLKRDKERKAKAALRKITRLRKELDLLGDTTDWEAEFTASISERLDKYGGAFADLSKGGYGEALSYAQKTVINNMRAKARRLKKERSDGVVTRKRQSFSYSSFKPKRPKSIKAHADEIEAPSPDELWPDKPFKPRLVK